MTKGDVRRAQSCFAMGAAQLVDGIDPWRAINAFECAIYCAPESFSQAYKGLGMAYTQLGRHQEAIKYYRENLETDLTSA
jgi:tetratricopeptide (TPR) repeat protein